MGQLILFVGSLYGEFFYQATIVIKEYKTDEFIECMRFLLPGFREEKGCLEYNLYRDVEKKIPTAWLESGRHAKPWKNTSIHSISKC
jgi:hypothetical protein